MIHYILFICLSLGIDRFPISIPNDEVSKVHSITRQMMDKTDQIQTLSYTMKRTERFGNKINIQSSKVKLHRNPYKVYTKQIIPDTGLEVLFVEGHNNGKALINPNGFPWVNLNLDPYGKIMRKNQHHLVLHAGYDYIVSIIRHLQHKYGSESINMLRLKGETIWDNQNCWIVEFTNPHFGFYDYTVKENETLVSIADRLKVNDYMILTNNKKIDHYDDISEGQIISVPVDYCKKMIVYIDQIRNIPMVVKIYDHKGIYEQYEFVDIKLDFPVQANEFSEDFPEYGF